MSKATPRRNKSSLKIFSTLQLYEGSSKGFLFFKEFNSPWFIFLRIRNFQPRPSCFFRRNPSPAGEAAAPRPQRSLRCGMPGTSVFSSTQGTSLLSCDLVLHVPSR